LKSIIVIPLLLFFNFYQVLAQNGNASLQKVYNVHVPQELYFAGEKVPLEDPEVRERLERELIINCYKHATTLIVLKRVNRWRNQIEPMLVEQGVPKDFFYLAVIESELEPYADSGKAHGFWQFTDGTARGQNLEMNKYVDQRRDPILSTQAAARHIKGNYAEMRNWTLAAAAYNLGLPTLKRVKNYQQMDNYYDLYLTSETARYVFRILAMKLIIENPEKYGFYLTEQDKYQPYNTTTVKVDRTIENIAKFALDNKINYKQLKQYNPWIRFDSKDDYTYRFEVAPGKVYYFQVPVVK
jgi:hypothetical protein